jgi:hypothetical protein
MKKLNEEVILKEFYLSEMMEEETNINLNAKQFKYYLENPDNKFKEVITSKKLEYSKDKLAEALKELIKFSKVKENLIDFENNLYLAFHLFEVPFIDKEAYL